MSVRFILTDKSVVSVQPTENPPIQVTASKIARLLRRYRVMAQESAARFFKAIQRDEALKAKLKATTDPETFVQIAADQGYHFTVAELETQIGKLTPEEIAAVINPGVGPRRHIVPR